MRGGGDRLGSAELGPHAPKELAEATFRAAQMWLNTLLHTRTNAARPEDDLAPAVGALFPEHTRIIAERLDFLHGDPPVVDMRGIDQTVVFVRREHGGH